MHKWFDHVWCQAWYMHEEYTTLVDQKKICFNREFEWLNDLKRTRLSRRRIIWLLPHPIPSPVSKLDRKRLLPAE